MHRLRYTAHASQRAAERDIHRRWVEAAVKLEPRRFGRTAIFVLPADQLVRRFGGSFRAGLRVVVDSIRRVIVTVHWLSGGES
jgi:hypothetical protein